MQPVSNSLPFFKKALVGASVLGGGLAIAMSIIFQLSIHKAINIPHITSLAQKITPWAEPAFMIALLQGSLAIGGGLYLLFKKQEKIVSRFLQDDSKEGVVERIIDNPKPGTYTITDAQSSDGDKRFTAYINDKQEEYGFSVDTICAEGGLKNTAIGNCIRDNNLVFHDSIRNCVEDLIFKELRKTKPEEGDGFFLESGEDAEIIQYPGSIDLSDDTEDDSSQEFDRITVSRSVKIIYAIVEIDNNKCTVSYCYTSTNEKDYKLVEGKISDEMQRKLEEDPNGQVTFSLPTNNHD